MPWIPRRIEEIILTLIRLLNVASKGLLCHLKASYLMIEIRVF